MHAPSRPATRARLLLGFLFACGTISLSLIVGAGTACGADGVFVRLRLIEPAKSTWFVRLGGYIHRDPWYLPGAVVPAGADRAAERRLATGTATEWFDLRAHAGAKLHGRVSRAGGVAEFPNVTADFVCDAPGKRTVEIELATAPDDSQVVKRWKETFDGSLTSFLVSPNLKTDAAELETAAEMSARRLKWAREATGGVRREATGGVRRAPRDLIVQTSFWAPQRSDLDRSEAEVVHLLGFNVVGNQTAAMRQAFPDLRVPGHTHHVDFGPAATREGIDGLMKGQAAQHKEKPSAGVPFGFTDEIVARPPIGTNAQALAHFRAWLAERKVDPRDLGAASLAEVVPIETPDVLRAREKENAAAARRVFYWTSKFRQRAATERIAWHTESFHKHYPPGPVTSTLLADHPYFAGSGLGMGMTPNPAWSGHPLACDWFDLARSRSVDLLGIEDWMGLQFMYGPNWTWEGFQLMGFQSAMIRSGGRGGQPIIAWITPSDEANLRLKTASALCQGAKHFFYWTYGPTATSTENYWSDLRGAYDGLAHVTKQLAAAERVIAPGKTRTTRVAVLYAVSSDLWQPFGYVSMLERRGLYLALVHEQYLVDFLCEEDVESGRLADYDVLYAADPCITAAAAGRIAAWVKDRGGHLFGTTAAGTRNEYGEPVPGLAAVFGIEPDPKVDVQPGRYHIRGALNGLTPLDEVRGEGADGPSFGAVGTRIAMKPTTARVSARFRDGSAAIVEHEFGKGRAVCVGTSPAIAYLREAKFVPDKLAEKWPASWRQLLTRAARERQVPRLVELSHPVVEAGVYDAPTGTALVLANFAYDPIAKLDVRLPVPKPVAAVTSAESGKLAFRIEPATGAGPLRHVVSFTLPLGWNDIVVLE